MFRQLLSKVSRRSQQAFGVKPLADSTPQMEQWFRGSLGQAVLAEEQQQVDRVVNYLFGYHLLQLSVSRQLDLSKNSTIHHRFAFTPNINPIPPIATNNCASANKDDTESTDSEQENSKECQQNSSATNTAQTLITGFADPEKIPLGSESIDVAVLHHVLEFSQNPHQLLRETARVLIPRGYVVVVGFNPFSWFGLYKQFARLISRRNQWRHHSLRLGRVIDWLRLLDFEPVEVTQGFYRLPIDNPSIMAKTQWYERIMRKIRLPMGGFYLILARKDVVAMTPIKPVWKKFNPIEGLVPNPRSPTTRLGDYVSEPDIRENSTSFMRFTAENLLQEKSEKNIQSDKISSRQKVQAAKKGPGQNKPEKRKLH